MTKYFKLLIEYLRLGYFQGQL